MKKMKSKIYLPIEVKRRELYSRIYFSIKASIQGYSVTIGRKSRFHEFEKKIQPGNYISKSAGTQNFDYIKRLKKAGHKIFFIDEEGLMSFNKEFTHRRFSEEGLQLMDVIFTWGNNHKNELIELYPSLKEKLKIVGNPRVDILKDISKQFYAEEIKKIKNYYGDFFLLVTKFGKINFVKRKNIIDYYTSHLTKGYLNTEKLKEICKRSIKHEEKNFVNFINFIKLFNASLENKKLLILVHPTEDLKIYEDIVGDMKNVDIASGEYSSNSWILSSDLIIQNNCTTALEAYLMGIKPIQLNFFQDKEVEYPIPNKISKIFSSNEKLISYLKDYKKENITKEDYINNLNFLTSYIENIDKKNSVNLSLEYMFDDFKIKNKKFFPFLEKTLFKLKNYKRFIINYMNEKNSMILSKNKFSGLDIEEVRVFMEKIISVENYKLEDFELKENLPGLFTIEYLK